MSKNVHVVGPVFDHGLVKAMYYDRSTQWLYPDFCMVDPDGNVLWQTNALRLRGPDVEPGAEIGIVWGDSVVFCTYRRGWPEMLNDYSKSCTFLNGGIEGIDYVGILTRAIDFNARHRVAANIIMPGWHPIGDNASFGADLEGALKQIPRAVLVTMPTSLNEDIANVDIGSQFNLDGGDDVGFHFYGSETYSLELQRQLVAHIRSRNAITTAVAQRTGTPLVDLFSALDSRGLTDFREDFFDISHPRPAAYPKIASKVWEVVGPILDAKSRNEPKHSLH
jgi:lysophospholipase L1-like esterase